MNIIYGLKNSTTFWREPKHYSPINTNITFRHIDNELKTARGRASGGLSEETKVQLLKIAASIKAFFENGELVLQQFQKLEAELELEAKSRFDSTTRTLVGYQLGQVYKHDKLFSNYLKKWAAENGFAGIKKLASFVSDKKFNKLLESKKLTKDSAFRFMTPQRDSSNQDTFYQHGEYTHIIQVWLLKSYLEQNPDFLPMPLADVYANMRFEGLWLSTFETSVFKLNEFLHQKLTMQHLPVLCQLILGREAKRAPLIQNRI